MRLALLSAVLVAATVAAYWPVFSAKFVDFDDGEYVYGNKRVLAGLTVDGAVWAFTQSHSANWHPLTWLSHMLDVQIFGLEAGGHHAVNLALHAANVVLLFLALTSIAGAAAPSFLVAAVFALHPTNVESVAWVSQRKSLLSALFALASIWSYARYARTGSRASYGASLAAFALSLMSKQMFVTLPLALLLLDYWPLERRELAPPAGERMTLRRLLRGWIRLARDKIPYALLSALACVATLLAQRGAIRSVETYPLALRLGNVVYAYVAYLGMTFWPSGLSCFYPLHQQDITLHRSLACAALLSALTALAVWAGLRRRYWLVGWFWFLGTLVPVVGLVQVGGQAMADRYLYATTWGLWAATAWSLYEGLGRSASSGAVRAAAACGVAAALGVLAWRTYEQSRTWKDSVSLFQNAIAQDPRNRVAHRVLAAQYFERGDYRKTLEHCERALAIGPRAADVLSLYGLTLYETGSPELAVQILEEAVRIDPAHSLSHTNLGWVLAQRGEYDRAAEHFARGAETLSRSATVYAHQNVYTNWGHALARLNRLGEAAEKFAVALDWDPESVGALCEAARVDVALNNLARAEGRLRRAAAVEPENGAVLHQLAGVCALRNKTAEAADLFARAVEASPLNYAAAREAARLYSEFGRPEEAQRVLRRSGAAMNNLAWRLATDPDARRRDPKKAIALATLVCEFTGGADPSALGTLAAAYAADGQYAAAADAAERGLHAARASNHPAAAQLERQLLLHQQGKPYIER
jgi:Tfp pilus assembly protein PilF